MAPPEKFAETPDRDRFIQDIIIPSGVSASVISAFEEVDRAEFMPRAVRDQAYTDQIIRVAKESTISQPTLVAKMIDLLKLQGREKVLEIGTATGYQAALISRLADHVDTVEIDRHLAYWAKSNLKRLNYSNVTVHNTDGANGAASHAPFDAIIVTAGVREIPQALIDQLAVGGRLVAPVGELPEDSRLTLFTKTSKTDVEDKDYGWCTFVPLFSLESGGWTRPALNEARHQKKLKIEERRNTYRQEMKATITEGQGEDGYLKFIRYIRGTAANIVSKKLTEDQTLDLFIFFSHIFRQNDEDEDSSRQDDGKEEAKKG